MKRIRRSSLKFKRQFFNPSLARHCAYTLPHVRVSFLDLKKKKKKKEQSVNSPVHLGHDYFRRGGAPFPVSISRSRRVILNGATRDYPTRDDTKVEEYLRQREREIERKEKKERQREKKVTRKRREDGNEASGAAEICRILYVSAPAGISANLAVLDTIVGRIGRIAIRSMYQRLR